VTVFDLAQFATAVHARAQQWEQASIRWQFTIGPEREKSGAWLSCETDDLLGELIVWTTGEAELAIADPTTGTVDQAHHDLTTAEDLDTCLSDLTHRLTQQTRPTSG
jgi:hypothetical protein